MTPLDLTARPPRSPRVLLGGYPMLARMIDRARASLAEGSLGSFVHLGVGLSGMVLGELAIEPQAFVAAVEAAKSDEDVLAWLTARVEPSRIAAATQRIASFRVRDIAPEHRPHVASLYPAELLSSCETCFDLIEADDRRVFGVVAA